MGIEEFKIGENLNESIAHALLHAIYAKDKYTGEHCVRVAKYSQEIARRTGKTETEIAEIYNAALIHDVGKIRIPESILNKEEGLSEDEFNFVKLHPIAGFNIVKELPSTEIVAGVKWHHEHYDGMGYPDGLKGDNIPEVARIIAVADAYDAMTSDRSYRNRLPQEEVLKIIESGKGVQFDPIFAGIMASIIREDVDFKFRQEDKPLKNILIIDDERINLFATERMLKDVEGYRVFKAINGVEGFEAALSADMDIILLDIEMPELDGFEVLELLKSVTKARIVFCTANKELETIQRAEKMGIRDYIVKPFTKAELLELLKQLD